MATPKTVDKKPTTKKPAAPAGIDPTQALATDVLTTLLHRALVRLGEPARLSEIVRETNEEAVTVGLARTVMEQSKLRFVAIDRRWDIAQRYLDKQRPVERTLEELLATYGGPMPADAIPGEMAHIYGRVREHFDEVAPRLLRGAKFFPTAQGLGYGLRAWLLNIDLEAEDDLLFYNYLSREGLAPFEKGASGLDWENDPVGAAKHVLSLSGGQPLDNRVVQYLAYKALGDEFDGAALYDALATNDAFLALPEHRWLLTEHMDTLRAVWRTQAEQVVDQPVEEPTEAAVEVTAVAQPLEVADEDAEDIRRYFEGREEIVTAGDLLANVLEVRPGSRTFAEDSLTLTGYLRSHPNDFLWVGNERFRAPGSLPPYIGQLPESLTFPTLPRFETADGEILDQMLSDEAFDADVQADILDPLAQDVNDQEPNDITRWPEGVSAEALSLRLVLKAHHKEIGTFPLAQVPFGFFPTEPNIVELTLRDTQGNAYPLYIDYNVQLVYGLFDVYADIAADSGAVFTLAKTDKPDEYLFTQENEVDANVFVSPARMEELMDFRVEVESSSVSTYDIIHRILEHYGKKGCSFLTLLTEVNLVRRTPRRLFASILSSYTAFHIRSTRWTFDAKKEQEGFDKSKAEFILK